MSEFQGAPSPQPVQHPYQPPKKKHTAAKIVFGIFAGIFLVIGGCTALIGGAGQDAKAPVDVTSKAAPVDNGPTPDPVATPTNEPTAPKATTQPSPKVTHKPAPTKQKLTAGQEQAVGAAQDYLSIKAFSRKGLIEQLSSEAGSGFSKADATYAVDHIDVDWNEQAVKAANEYLAIQHFSRSGLIEQLESSAGSQFTHSQAVYGVTKAGL